MYYGPSLGIAGLLGLLVLSLSLPGHTAPQPQSGQNSGEQIAPMKMGIFYAKTEKFEQARESFKNVLAQEPKNAAAYNNLGNLNLLEGKYASAMKKYWEALQHDPKDTNIYLNLGVVYSLQMEITPDAVYVGRRKSENPKKDWQALAEEAFDKAFEKIKSVSEACYLLEIPSKDTLPEYQWLQILLDEAATRTDKERDLKKGGGRSGNQREVFVYWKLN